MKLVWFTIASFSSQCLSLAVLQVTNAGVRRPGNEARKTTHSPVLHIPVMQAAIIFYFTMHRYRFTTRACMLTAMTNCTDVGRSGYKAVYTPLS